jgi:hypothetical protein
MIGYRDKTSSDKAKAEQDVIAYTRYTKSLGKNMKLAYDETY